MANEQNSFEAMFGPASVPSQDTRSFADVARESEKREQIQAAKASDQPSGFWEQAADIGAGGGSGLGRGLVGVTGFGGDVGQLAARAPAYGTFAQQWMRERLNLQPRDTALPAYQKKMQEIEAGMTPEQREGKVGNVFGWQAPTSATQIKRAAEYAPWLEYEPKTGAGRVAQTVGEFVGSAPAFEGAGALAGSAVKGLGAASRVAATGAPTATALGEGARVLAQGAKAAPTAGLSASSLATNVGAGLGSGVSGEAFKGEPGEAGARFLGAIPGALAGRAGYARFSPAATEERSLRLAADVLRDQGLTEAEIKAALPRQGEFVEGLQPTTTQLLQRPDIESLARESRAALPASEAARTGTEDAFRAAQQRGAVMGAAGEVPEIIQSRTPFSSMSDALGIGTDNPMATSSSNAAKVFEAVEKPAFDAKETIWKDPVFKDAAYHKDDVKNAIQKAFDDMGVSRDGLPKEMNNYLDALQNYGSNAIPFSELQKTKALANSILRNPNVLDKSGAYSISKHLDDIMTDVNSLHPDSLAKASTAPQVFDDARNVTRNYHEIFGTDVTSPLSDRYSGGPMAGKYAMEPEKFLDSILKQPKDALGKLRELKAIPNMDQEALNNAVADYMVGKVTQNGTKPFVTPKDIQSALKDPAYQQIVAETPGLQMRLNKIAKQSVGEQVINGFDAVLQRGDPNVLSQYIAKNKGLIFDAIRDPNKQAFINQLERSSNILKQIPAGKIADPTKFDLLTHGNMFTLLHGVGAGKVAQAAAGAIAGKAVGMAAPVAAGLEIAGAGAGALGLIDKPGQYLSRVVYGPMRERAITALNKAMDDPEFMQFLLQKPTISNTMRLRNILEAMPEAAPSIASASKYPAGPEQKPVNVDEEYEKLVKQGKIKNAPQQNAGGRVGRASGGSVVSANKADQLVRAAESAKKAINSRTEVLLDQPDEKIASALAIAKRHI